jgi:hypothetical protein
MTDEAQSEQEPECGFGKCVKEHPLHCCHTAVGVHQPAAQKGAMLHGWVCVFCRKRSRAAVLTRMMWEPRV